MIPALALVVAMAADSGDGWLGRDKAKHFLLSAFIHSVVFSATRIGADRRPAQFAAGGAVLAAAVLKETRDRRAGRPFSPADIAWGIAGGAASASLMNGTP